MPDPAKQAAGRAGGLATLNRHGVDHYRALGKAFGALGGRPTYQEANAKAWARQHEAEKRARTIRKETQVSATPGPLCN